MQAARAAKKESAPSDKPKKSNGAAQAKKLNLQLEGLDRAEEMVNDLLSAGVGTLAGSSAQTYEKLAKDLGGYYLTGPQTAFARIALAVRAIQNDPGQSERAYAEGLRILIALRSTIKKSRVFLQQKLKAGQYFPEDSVLFEALGGVWRLEDLHAIGAFQENARLVQLSFDVSYDQAKREYVERGFWLDLDSGEIGQTLNLRPVKALKYVKGTDNCFDLLEVPVLYRYPGEGTQRVRWESCATRPISAQERAQLPTLAQPDIPTAVKGIKGQIKNALAPKFGAALVPLTRLGTVGQELVMEDGAGNRLVLRDRPEEGEDHASIARFSRLPGEIPEGSTLFGLMFYDDRDRRICLHPYSLVTLERIVRLQF